MIIAQILFQILMVILLLLALILVLVGGLYVLSIELQWWLDVDVFYKLKRKVRAYVYAETKEERKTLVRMLRGRKGRGKQNLERFQTIKKRLCHGKNNRKTVQIPKVKVKEKA